MHRWGSCRNHRIQDVGASIEPGTSTTQIEMTCPSCFKLMHPNQDGRQLHG
jgi:hypothetical protein